LEEEMTTEQRTQTAQIPVALARRLSWLTWVDLALLSSSELLAFRRFVGLALWRGEGRKATAEVLTRLFLDLKDAPAVVNVTELARRAEVSRPTVYRALRYVANPPGSIRPKIEKTYPKRDVAHRSAVWQIRSDILENERQTPHKQATTSTSVNLAKLPQLEKQESHEYGVSAVSVNPPLSKYPPIESKASVSVSLDGSSSFGDVVRESDPNEKRKLGISTKGLPPPGPPQKQQQTVHIGKAACATLATMARAGRPRTVSMLANTVHFRPDSEPRKRMFWDEETICFAVLALKAAGFVSRIPSDRFGVPSHWELTDAGREEAERMEEKIAAPGGVYA
jgi:hypothetical protein